MNLSEPLEGLTTLVEAAVLRVLARSDAGFSGRQVHALAGIGSTSSVHRALVGFVELGLVSSEPHPPAIIYRVNRAHVLWPVVEAALAARSRAFEAIATFCEEDLPDDPELTVIVYGSVARRESTLESDVDILVVYPDGIDPDARADFDYQLGANVRRITGNEAQIFSLEREDFVRRKADGDPFIGNVLTDGILVHGSPISFTTRVDA
jgi:predicted nucleotidyltransferase